MATMPTSQQFDRVWTVLGLCSSSLFAAFSPAAPTGIVGWNHVLMVTFGAIAPLVMGWTPRWVWFGALAVTGGFAAEPAWLVVAALGMILAAALEVSNVESQLARVAVGIAIVHGLLHLRPIGSFGVSAALAGLVLLVGLVTSLLPQRPTARRFVYTFGGAVVWFVAIAAAAAGLTAVQARSDLDAGSVLARQGLESARDGETDLAALQLADSSERLRRADERLRAWWVEPSRLIPIIGQHVDVARAASGPIADLVEASSLAIEFADVDRLKLTDGAVDLELVASMAEPLGRVKATMSEAIDALDSAESGWVLGPVRSQLTEARQELHAAYPDAVKAADATALLPGLLGADGPQNYLVMFATTAEARELGGILGSFVELEANDGSVRVVAGGSDADLNRAGPGVLADPSRYPRRFIANSPELFSQNWTGMPDVPRVAEAVGELYPSMGGEPIDGVVYIDPVGIAALLRLAGPVELAEIGLTVDADNVVEFLQVDQYRSFDDQGDRKSFLTTIATSTFDHLLSADLPSPRVLGDLLGPAARGGHLQFATIDPAPHDFLASLHLLGAFPTPDGSDFLAVVHSNGSANKLDSFLHRTVGYRVRLDDDGSVESSVEVTLRADVPSGLPAYVTGTPPDDLPIGSNRVHLSIITSQFLEEVSINGDVVPVEPQAELGYQRYLVFVDVPPDSSSVVRFELTGTVEPGSGQSTGDYRLTMANQARVLPDEVHVLVERASDGRVIGETSVELVEDTIIEFER